MPKKLLEDQVANFFGGKKPKFLSLPLSSETLEISSNLIEITPNAVKLKQLTHTNQRLVVLITGLSGAGKDAISNTLAQTGLFELVINSTSRREIREGETKHFPYRRIKDKKFKKMIKRGQLLEWVRYSGCFYGSSLEMVKEVLAKGKIPILRIDPKGNKNVLRLWQENSHLSEFRFISLFAIPESWQSLIQRLNSRDLLSQPKDKRHLAKQKVKRRIEQNKIDLHFIKEPHYLLINETGKLQAVASQVIKLIEERQTELEVLKLVKVLKEIGTKLTLKGCQSP
jgi:guanylate kinase